MATMVGNGVRARPARDLLAVGTSDRILAAAAVGLLAAVLVAIGKGQGEWHRVPPMVWAHLLTITVALALTPAMLLRPRGTRAHRRLGALWVAAMFATALISLFVHTGGRGRFSVIHLLSVWTLIQVPLIWWTARTHQERRHRGAVRGMVIGALLIAGFFTFPFHRLLGQWLFG